MKELNKAATAVFLKLVGEMVNDYVKVDNANGAFIPVTVEKIGDVRDFELISVSHYSEQNGDLMRDPEMCFLLDKSRELVFPYYYRNDFAGMEDESILFDGGEVKGIKPRMQKDHAYFANIWMKNIKYQQF